MSFSITVARVTAPVYRSLVKIPTEVTSDPHCNSDNKGSINYHTMGIIIQFHTYVTICRFWWELINFRAEFIAMSIRDEIHVEKRTSCRLETLRTVLHGTWFMSLLELPTFMHWETWETYLLCDKILTLSIYKWNECILIHRHHQSPRLSPGPWDRRDLAESCLSIPTGGFRIRYFQLHWHQPSVR